MTASKIPAVEDALVTLATSALSGVTIIFGPLIAQQLSNDDAFAVGSSQPDVTSSSATRTLVGFGAVADERFDIQCALQSNAGGQDVKARRDRVAQMLDALDSAIRTDPTLGHTVGFALITNERWSYAANEQGVACDLSFTVSGLAMP